jgi:Mg-chelatase subunit ChlD
MAQQEFFLSGNGGRPSLPKILFLLTDGAQTTDPGAENPASIADELRAIGMTVIVVGIGKQTDKAQLNSIAGGHTNAYSASSFDELTSREFINKLTEKGCKEAKKPNCKSKADVGFLLDSSGSLKADYQREKDFMKTLTKSFGISKHGSRASVITFSGKADLSIKFNHHYDTATFNNAVDRIPYLDDITRLDLALRRAQSQMFLPENGARLDAQDVLILLTDGAQTEGNGAEHPGDIANELRKSGVKILVVGIGSETNPTELEHMAGNRSNVYSAKSFDELMGGEFLKRITDESCKAVTKEQAPPGTFSEPSVCKDRRNCLNMVKFCNSPRYHKYIQHYCAKTCNKC